MQSRFCVPFTPAGSYRRDLSKRSNFNQFWASSILSIFMTLGPELLITPPKWEGFWSPKAYWISELNCTALEEQKCPLLVSQKSLLMPKCPALSTVTMPIHGTSAPEEELPPKWEGFYKDEYYITCRVKNKVINPSS